MEPTQLQTLEEVPSTQEVLQRIAKAKRELGERVMILAHHYQRDEIYQFGDAAGDSFALAKAAAYNEVATAIVFCGVHFMAESADILTPEGQPVLLPDLNAGCTMADMAPAEEVEEAWELIQELQPGRKLLPVAYINTYAEVKSLIGEAGGSICTSSNAGPVLEWAFRQADQIFFVPDQHLGRLFGHQHGIPLDQMVVYDPQKEQGGLTLAELQKAKVVLWKGHCSVHQQFNLDQIDHWRKEHPDIKIAAHGECSFEVVQASDFVGSTEGIKQAVRASPPGTKWAIATEHHLVNRLASEQKDKFIATLTPFACQCSTMYRIDPYDLMLVLEGLVEGRLVNQVKVPADIRKGALVALQRMLDLG